MSLHNILIDLVILLAIATASVILFKRARLGSIVGLLVAGVVLGPSGLAITSNPDGLRKVTELGVVFLLFIIGLEMHPERLWLLRRMVFGLGSLQLGVTGVAIAAYTLLLGLGWNAAIIVGLGLAMSSTAFVMQLLDERSETRTDYGQTTFAILLLQDLAIVPILALVPLLSNQSSDTHNSLPVWLQGLEIFGGLLAVYLLGCYVIPFVLKIAIQQRNREAFAGIVGFTVIGAAWIMDTVGLSLSLGAFFIGMLLSGSHYRHYLEAEIEPFKNTLLSLFFISVGMSINLNDLLNQGFVMLGLALALMCVKATILFLLSLAFGLSRSAVIRVASLLPQCGEFGFVLFSAAVAAGLITPQMFSRLVTIIVTSMVATPLLVRLGNTLAQRYSTPLADSDSSLQELNQSQQDSRVLVIGYGRVGQVVCTILEQMDVPYLALDKDLDHVSRGRETGRAVYFGDVSNSHILSAARVSHAQAVIITVGDAEVTEKLVVLLRNSHPHLPLVVRSRNLSQREEMLADGVTYVVPEVVEAALMMGEKTLEILGISELEANSLLSLLRKDDYAALHLQNNPD